MLKALGRGLLSLLFPSHCELCARLTSSGETSGVCDPCAGEVALIPGPHCPTCGRTTLAEEKSCPACAGETFYFDRAYACVLYQDNMKKLLHQLKFGKKRYLIPFFSKLMAGFCQRHLTKVRQDIVLPVPMDRKRRFERGFNQSDLLGSRLATSLGSAYHSGALACKESKTPQSFLTKSARKDNVVGRFFVRRPEIVRSKDILLVDDILTTGQTASACAKALKEAGARSVTTLAFARGA